MRLAQGVLYIVRYVKVLAKHKFSKIVIHLGTNDVRLLQSEISKNNVKEVCELANMISETVICSGPLADCCHSMAGCLSGDRRIT